MPLDTQLSLERDESVVEGRPKRSGTTYGAIPGAMIFQNNTVSHVLDQDRYSGWIARSPITIDQLACEVTTAGAGNLRMGVYRADRDWQPFGAPLTDSGDIDGSTTGLKTFTPASPLFFRPGRYLSVTNISANMTLRAYGGGIGSINDSLASSSFITGYTVSRSYAAFPTPGTPWTGRSVSTVACMFHVVVFRVTLP